MSAWAEAGGLAGEHSLSAERWLLWGDWREVAYHDQQARFWRLFFRVQRVRQAWLERQAARAEKPKRSRAKRATAD